MAPAQLKRSLASGALAAVMLAGLVGCRSVESSSRDLHSENDARVAAAVKWLGNDPTSDSLRVAHEAAKAERVETRAAGFEILVRRADGRSFPRFVHGTTDPDPRVRVLALRGLAAIGNPDGLSAVERILQAVDEPANVREVAVDTKARLRNSAVDHYLRAANAAGEDLETLVESIHQLGALGDARAVGPMKEIFQRDPRAPVRQAVLWSLGDIGNAEAFRFGVATLGHEDSLARAAAIYVVGRHTLEEAVPALGRIADADSEGNRVAAVRALGEIGDPAARAVLEALARGDHEEWLASEIRGALAKSKDTGGPL